ncbi:hypothetical protein [Nonomuraea sp. NPDC049400]|uniref:hypothetical protein n=1 Tax=Nonomuraea sp. NPDC049400 TaxID=3364352 RepID=UPI003797BBC3
MLVHGFGTSGARQPPGRLAVADPYRLFLPAAAFGDLGDLPFVHFHGPSADRLRGPGLRRGDHIDLAPEPCGAAVE